MGGQELLHNIAFIVSMVVIILMAIVFSVLFGLYGRYKIKNINNGHEDGIIEKDIRRKYKKIVEGVTKTKIKEENAFKYRLYQKEEKVETYILEKDPDVKIEETIKEPVTIYDTIVGSTQKNKKYQVVLKVIFGIFYFLIGFTFLVALLFKIWNQAFYFGDYNLLTIQTASMETVHESNTYIKENDLDDQIKQYSLISIERVKSDDELNVYDIAAYKYKDTTYVHRIVRKYTNETTGITYYTFKGDANSNSLSFELTVTLDQIVGKYTGFQNYGLGVTLIYLQSTIGMVALASALIFLLTYNITEGKIETAYYQRILIISKQIDKELGLLHKEVS